VSDVPAAKPTPRLSVQETAVLVGYASGLKLDAVARRAGIRPSTARQYLNRVKQKYLDADRPARTKLELAERAREDGLLS
jgi:two-component system, NarL family, nitrate/nitrite response regulator NarL